MCKNSLETKKNKLAVFQVCFGHTLIIIELNILAAELTKYWSKVRRIVFFKFSVGFVTKLSLSWLDFVFKDF